jgi:hypothetical protein
VSPQQLQQQYQQKQRDLEQQYRMQTQPRQQVPPTTGARPEIPANTTEPSRPPLPKASVSSRETVAPLHAVSVAPDQRKMELSPSATLITRPGHSGFTAVSKESARSSIVVEQHADRQGHTSVSAYRQVTSTDGRTTTRLYADGRRTVDAPNFHSTGQLDGPQFVRFKSGLRAAYLPNGRALYTEKFAKVHTAAAGGNRQTLPVVQRTIYATRVGGRFTELPVPINRFYTIAPVGGNDTFVYRPRVFSPDFYPVLYVPLAAAIVVGTQRYSDPIDYLADRQVADAVADQGVAPIDDPVSDPDAGAAPEEAVATAEAPPPPPPPELIPDAAGAGASDAADTGDIREKADALQAQVAKRAIVDATPAADIPAAVVAAGNEPTIELLPVPPDVRDEIHKQVRLSVAQHANERPLSLTDVMQSGYARIYIFQVAVPLDTASVVTGDGCALGSGDLIAFAAPGGSPQHPTAQMKVIATRPGHCLMQDMIDVSVSDLQEMLNTFNQRLEANMRRLQTCMASRDGCVRS